MSIKFNTNNFNPAFKARLEIVSPTQNFPFSKKDVDKMQYDFYRNTKESYAKMTVVHDEIPTMKPCCSFRYENGAHKDYIDAYWIKDFPKSVKEYTERLIKIADVFAQREQIIRQIKDFNTNMEQNTQEQLKDVFGDKVSTRMVDLYR